MNYDDLTPLLLPDDLKSPLDKCAKAIGIENIILLADTIPGERITIPKKDVMFNTVRKRLIIAEYQQGNCSMKSLADKYEVCERTVFNYINGKNKGKRP